MGWPLLLLWCLLCYEMSYTFIEVNVKLWVGLNI